MKMSIFIYYKSIFLYFYYTVITQSKQNFQVTLDIFQNWKIWIKTVFVGKNWHFASQRVKWVVGQWGMSDELSLVICIFVV